MVGHSSKEPARSPQPAMTKFFSGSDDECMNLIRAYPKTFCSSTFYFEQLSVRVRSGNNSITGDINSMDSRGCARKRLRELSVSVL